MTALAVKLDTGTCVWYIIVGHMNTFHFNFVCILMLNKEF